MRVYREQSPGTIEGPSSDEEDGPTPQPQANGHRPVTEPLPPLSKETQTRVAELVVRLASKSQYSKVCTPAPMLHDAIAWGRGE